MVLSFLGGTFHWLSLLLQPWIRSSDSKILSPFQILEGKHRVFHHLYINYSFFTDILYSIQFEKFSFFSLVKILTIDSCWILSTFSTYIKMTTWFILCSGNVANYIDCFTNIKPIYIPEMNFIWPLYTTFFHVFELLILVDNFLSISTNDIHLYLSYNVFVKFWYQDCADHIKYIEK